MNALNRDPDRAMSRWSLVAPNQSDAVSTRQLVIVIARFAPIVASSAHQVAHSRVRELGEYGPQPIECDTMQIVTFMVGGELPDGGDVERRTEVRHSPAIVADASIRTWGPCVHDIDNSVDEHAHHRGYSPGRVAHLDALTIAYHRIMASHTAKKSNAPA